MYFKYFIYFKFTASELSNKKTSITFVKFPLIPAIS